MTLAMISPFTYGEYCQQISGFAEWMAEYVHQNKINGRAKWREHFESYQFLPSAKSWEEGVKTRREFHANLKVAKSGKQLLKVANNIMDWGFHKDKRFRYAEEDMPTMRKALDALDVEASGATLTKQQCCDLFNYAGSTPRIAPKSKIYEMHAPWRWTIYDARVASALARLVRRFWTGNGKETDAGLLRFPIPPRRPVQGWTQPKGFPVVSSRCQVALAFVYASWLLRLVAKILNANSKYGYPPTTENPERWVPLDAKWAVYGVEMVLWMMGDKNF